MTQNKDGPYIYTTGPEEKSRPQRTANIGTLFVIKIKETAGELETKGEWPSDYNTCLLIVSGEGCNVVTVYQHICKVMCA